MSIAVPMLNELGAIADCLDRFGRQTYPLELLDVMVIDGGSTDGSREFVEAYATDHGFVRLVDNPRGTAAAAFNVGMHQARGEVVCLFSSHGEPDEHYVERSVDTLVETGAAGVGGSYHHVGVDPASHAVGLAMVSPFGMASAHRFAATRRDVDTISHPAYVRAAMLAVGDFDERLARNSDYEFNHRMTAAGGRLVLEPTVHSIYRPRPGLRALGRQFWHYGRWKARVAARHRGSIRPRHLVAPAAVLGALATPILALLVPPVRPALVAIWALYVLGVVAAVVHAARHDRHPGRPGRSTTTLALAFPVMHAAWGAGFCRTLLDLATGRAGDVDRSRAASLVGTAVRADEATDEAPVLVATTSTPASPESRSTP